MENVNIEKKIPKTKQIVYKYFNEMLSYTNSQFYKNILIKCTRAKFLKGFSIEIINKDSEVLYIIKTKSSKKKNFVKFIELSDGSYTSYCKFIDFLKLNDIYELNNILNLKQPDVPSIWSKLKSNVKKKYLAEFTFEKCNENLNQSKILYSKIVFGLMMGYIQNSDIIIDNKSIVNIKNVKIDHMNIEFNISDKILNNENKDIEKQTVPKTSQLWQKYLSNLFKKTENDAEEDISLYEKEVVY